MFVNVGRGADGNDVQNHRGGQTLCSSVAPGAPRRSRSPSMHGVGTGFAPARDTANLGGELQGADGDPEAEPATPVCGTMLLRM